MENSSSNIAWMDNGILYHEYKEDLTLVNVLAIQKASLKLLDEHQLDIVPMIVLLESIDKERFKLTFGDYARVLSTFDIARHVSGIWLIGVAESVKQTIKTITDYFSVHHIYFAENLKEAQEAANLVKSSQLSIIDRQ